MNTQSPVRPGFMPQGSARIVPATAKAVVPSAPAPEPYIDKAEVAKRLGRTVRCVDNWMKRKLIPYFKIGRTVAFKWSEVEAHLSQHCRVGRPIPQRTIANSK